MSELILHHYPGSPFSEKVRLVFGLKAMRWRSVHVPVTLPKPDVAALTGGYRRTPFMQVGADVWCDSALMCRVIDRMAPEPPLWPAASAGLADIVAQWADSALFWAAIPFTMQPAGIAEVFPGIAPEQLKAFATDRAAMTPAMRRAPAADAGAALAGYLARLEAMLADARPFLLGALPCIADFSVVQSVWFMRRAPTIAARLAAFPRVAAWAERVMAFGHGEGERLDATEAIAIARAASTHEPTSVAAGEPFAAGDAVTVTAADYAHDEVAGRLVGLDPSEVVIARDDDRAGRVHVHFPRIGFHIKPLQKASA